MRREPERLICPARFRAQRYFRIRFPNKQGLRKQRFSVEGGVFSREQRRRPAKNNQRAMKEDA
jgi:hypothetical protein